MATESVSGATVVVTGAAGALGRAVGRLLDADPTVGSVIAVDRKVTPAVGAASTRTVDLATADLKPLFDGASVVLHLAQADPDAACSDAALAHRVLDAAGSVGVEHLVLLSSAAAYGAWANNPVPLTEDAALRPNPDAAFAAGKAEIERAAADFREDHPGTTVTLLRPVPTVSAGGNGRLARLLRRGGLAPPAPTDPPAQFVDVADVASAVDLARRLRIDGPRNVAPDGWLDGEAARALAGGGPRLRVPERLSLRIERTRARWGLPATPPELIPYVVHPWVVANDRLRADGWVPTASNEEAFVAGRSAEAGDRPTLSRTGRRQLAVGVALVGAALVARRRRRRRR
jgi:nucleoside-diphosphate-sugar epimerase